MATKSTISTTKNSDSLINKINKGLSLNLRSINSQLSKLFHKYSMVLDKIQGGDVFNDTQIRQLQYNNGVFVPYSKGTIVFNNDVDNLQYLLQNRSKVAETIGVTSSEIYANRRNFGVVSEYISKMVAKYDLGDENKKMQMYISKYDGNIGSSDSSVDWVDYILTQDWVDRLGKETIGNSTSENNDYRLDYLSNMVQGMMADHVIDYHKNMDKFNPSLYVDRVVQNSSNQKYQEAFNMFMSMGSVDYGFYEMLKPIGGTTERYIKVKLSSNGIIDISGVVSLDDCIKIDWKYGSMEYLRSLNTGNQRYWLIISKPFNDLSEDNPLGSILWWLPDEPEPLSDNDEEENEEDEEDEEDIEEKPKRYYKPYETERFLRWFGTSYIPIVDPNKIYKMTVCSAPRLSNDVQSSNFHADATNLSNMDMRRAVADNTTSLSLLSTQPTATIRIDQDIYTGQYLEFVVTGNRQTTALAFNVQGQMYNAIQEMNHFVHTWNMFQALWVLTKTSILFNVITMGLNPTLEQAWKMTTLGQEEDWIPQNWIEIDERLNKFELPNVIDLIRFRQIDFDQITLHVQEQIVARKRFMDSVDNRNKDNSDLFELCGKDRVVLDKLMLLLQNTNPFYNKYIDEYIRQYDEDEIRIDGDVYTKDQCRRNMPYNTETIKEVLDEPLNGIYHTGMEKEKQTKWDNYNAISYNDDVDTLRDRVQTLNKLIVRLPTKTEHQKLTSKHIFQDWKNYVDKTIENLLKDKKLFKKDTKEVGKGTDGEIYDYYEYYTDSQYSNVLIDYSYCYRQETDKDGNPVVDDNGMPVMETIHDRWDYWTENDFE